MRFLKYGTYHGPVAKLEVSAPAWEKNCNQSAGEENGLTMDITNANQAVLKFFRNLNILALWMAKQRVKPWMNKSFVSETSFLKAMEITLTLKFPLEDDENKELAEALIKVIGESCGGTRYDEDITRFMMSPKCEAFHCSTVVEPRLRCENWEQKMHARDHTPNTS